MTDSQHDDVRRALASDTTIDIVTLGAKSGMWRTTEIWFTRIDGAIYLCGTPSADGEPGRRRPRDWLANLKANPEFDFVLKESASATLPAVGREITDVDERRRVYTAPETQWYRDQAGSVEVLVTDAPLVAVRFRDHAAVFNPT